MAAKGTEVSACAQESAKTQANAKESARVTSVLLRKVRTRVVRGMCFILEALLQ